MTTIASSVAAQLRLARRARVIAPLTLAALLSLAGAAHAESRPDVWVTTQVRAGLLTAQGLSHTRRIHVDTIDGHVTLYGTVATEAQKAQAETVARNVEGAVGVRNFIQVVGEQDKKIVERADQAIERSVTSALKDEWTLAASSIKVRSVTNGVVLLRGTANTLSAHVRALEVASRVDGVRQVASEIESPNALGDAEIWREGAWDPGVASKSPASDMWTTSAVKLRLLANTETPGFDINVDTEGGVVTLFGTVDSQQAKIDAEDEARKVDGVREVKNQLQVVPAAAPSAVAGKDSDVMDAVRRRLGQSTMLSDAKLGVEVKNGVVRISGTVTSQVDRLTALTVARMTKGARRVVDDIKVVPSKVTSR